MFSENYTFHKIMRKIITGPDRPQMTMWQLGIVCCVPKAKNTKS